MIGCWWPGLGCGAQSSRPNVSSDLAKLGAVGVSPGCWSSGCGSAPVC